MKQLGIPQIVDQKSNSPEIIDEDEIETILTQQKALPIENKNMDRLKQICNEIERKQEEIDQQRSIEANNSNQIVSTSTQENLALTEWLLKIKNYTEEIMAFGDDKIVNDVTLLFIQEGEAILF